MSDVNKVLSGQGNYGFEDTVAREKANEAILVADEVKTNSKFEISVLKSAIELNVYNLLGTGESKTIGNLVWTLQSDGSMNINGTNGNSSSLNYLAGDSSASYMPDGFVAGGSYHLDFYSGINTLLVRIEFYENGTFISRVDAQNPTDFTIPANTTGIRIFYRASPSAVFNNLTFKAVILNTLTNEEIIKKIDSDLDATLKLTVPSSVISSGEDLNNYKTAGSWRISSAANASSIANTPVSRAGRLIVIANTANIAELKTLTQFYIANGNDIYFRYYSYINSVETFTDWKRVADISDVTIAVENVFSLTTDSKPALNTNDDLNTFLTAGQWKVPSKIKAESLKNKPKDFASTGLLTVFNTHNTNHVYQVIATNGNTNMWIRHIRIDLEQFNEWKSIVTAEDGRYSWQKAGFIIHSPNEENTSMVEVFDKYLTREISDSTVWAEEDEYGKRTVTATDIYSMWDALRSEYPDYIDAGETIGYSLDTTGANYMPVKAYYIHPRLTYGNTQIQYSDMPTLYLTAGTHGGEGSPVWNLFEIFRRAFLTGTIYSAFLKGMKFRVIPCLDCWCYDNKKRYLAAAYNADGSQKVSDDDLELYNANRQCIVTNPSNPSYATLNIPAYASEANALTKYLNDHNFGTVNGDSYVDMHNCSYSLGYLTSDDPNIANAYNVMMDELAKDWKSNTTWANGDVVDYYAGSTSDHTTLRGKILAKPSIENSYAWFFEKAYPSFCSNIMEVQQSDGSSCNKYAIAKGLDVTYRWFDTLIEMINKAR